MRTVARSELSSTKQATTRTCCSFVNLFINALCLSGHTLLNRKLGHARVCPAWLVCLLVEAQVKLLPAGFNPDGKHLAPLRINDLTRLWMMNPRTENQGITRTRPTWLCGHTVFLLNRTLCLTEEEACGSVEMLLHTAGFAPVPPVSSLRLEKLSGGFSHH